MVSIDRRRLFQLGGAAAAAAMLTDSIERAAAIAPSGATGSIQDVEHIVILMQENRSFDHYFGSLRGVRGYGEPHPVKLPSGKSVWHQADTDGTEVLPFHPTPDPSATTEKGDLALTFIEDLDHNWTPTHKAFNAGNWDQWIPNKTSTTMAHLTRKDLPFHYALADAFTVCDAYHCSLFGPTDPNRYYMWTGWVGNDGAGGGPVIANDEIGYSWTTFPERLLGSGVSWKIYQDVGAGLTADEYWGWGSDPYIGNYGDNSLLYFKQYQDSKPDQPLYDAALTGTDIKGGNSDGSDAIDKLFDALKADVQDGTLPQVSWIVAPEAFTEHPAWPAGYGAWYTANVLDALTSNPDVWSKTALLITFDENDGFFDHVVPPYPNVGLLPGASTVSTEHEFFGGVAGTEGGTDGVQGPYGLGVRVPMLVVSPWSTGGYVCSETFDHTSLIRFIEQRFGVLEPNITDWRRTVAGDLTSAFDFAKTSASVPTMPDVSAYEPTQKDSGDYKPTPPTTGSVPTQEPGVRKSRKLGYQLDAVLTMGKSGAKLVLRNSGHLGAHFQLRSAGLSEPRTFTVGAGRSLNESVPVKGDFDLELHGPNGFYRRWAGKTSSPLTVAVVPAGASAVEVKLSVPKSHHSALKVRLTNAYGAAHTLTVHPGRTLNHSVSTAKSGGWYDVSLTVSGDHTYARTFAGRLETTPGLTSDPQLGR